MRSGDPPGFPAWWILCVTTGFTSALVQKSNKSPDSVSAYVSVTDSIGDLSQPMSPLLTAPETSVSLTDSKGDLSQPMSPLLTARETSLRPIPGNRGWFGKDRGVVSGVLPKS